VPVLPAKPRKLFILAGGLLLGLAAAIAATMLAEMGDEAFSTADQIESVLGLPVLGTFTMRRRLEVRRVETPAYIKLLPILVLLAGLAVPTSIALGFDQLDPSYGERLVVRDPQGNLIEILYPNGGQSRGSWSDGWSAAKPCRTFPPPPWARPAGR
jgi:hypothetical protein